MATIRIQMRRINKLVPSAFKHELEIECEMTKQQMSDAFSQFLENITDDELAKWLEKFGIKVCG